MAKSVSGSVALPSIPIVEARTPHQILSTGRTAPVLMTCEGHSSENGTEYSEYVVKLFSNIDLREKRLAREMYAALLAIWFELHVPKVALVQIPAGFFGTTSDPSLRIRLEKSQGTNFGSEYLTKLVLADGDLVSEEGRQCALEVFAFDMLIQNLDRRAEKPNAFANGDDYILFDHEFAFGACANPSLWLGSKPDPWDIGEWKPKEHLFYRAIRGNGTISLDRFADRLVLLSDEYLAWIGSQLPGTWQSSEISNITAHLLLAAQNARRFTRGIQEALA